MDEQKYYIWLSLCFSFSSPKPNELLNIYKNPSEIYQADKNQLKKLGFLNERDLKMLSSVNISSAEAIIERCEEYDISIVTIEEKLFPKRLRLIYGCPPVLYYKGDISGLDDHVVITVVGTREASQYSMDVTQWIARDLARAGAIVVSGCAVGIDAAAHFGALKGKGRTIGILGCGLDVDYPSRNKLLKEEILKRGGGLISELPPLTGPTSNYFPVRNRLMAGVSLGVLLTQTPVRSGSLITAEHALEQGKEVYCVPPASIMDSDYMGVMKYIRDGSTVVASAQDILMDYYYDFADTLKKDKIIGDYIEQKKSMQDEDLDKAMKKSNDNKKSAGSAKPPKKEKSEKQARETVEDMELSKERFQALIAPLSPQQQLICSAVKDNACHVEEICQTLSISMPVILAAITELEIMGILISVGGKRYTLNDY